MKLSPQAGSACDVLVTDGTLHYWLGNELVYGIAGANQEFILGVDVDSAKNGPSRCASVSDGPYHVPLWRAAQLN
jgi:hypothetical protein